MTSVAWKLAAALKETYGIRTESESELAEFLMEHGVRDLEYRLMDTEAALKFTEQQRDEFRRALKGKP